MGTEAALLWLTNSLGFAISSLWTVAAWRLGHRKRYGWILYAICEVSWIGYAVLLKQWTIIPWSVVHGTIYMRNWLKWKTAT